MYVAMVPALADCCRAQTAPSRVAFDALRRQVEVFRELGYDVDASGTPTAPTTSNSGAATTKTTVPTVDGECSRVLFFAKTKQTSSVEKLLRDQLRQRESAAASATVARDEAIARAAKLEKLLVRDKTARIPTWPHSFVSDRCQRRTRCRQSFGW